MKTIGQSTAFQLRAVQVAQFLQQEIQTGHYRERLPSERALAGQMGVGRDTIRAALALLQQEGLIVARGRNGTLVRKSPRAAVQNGATVGVLLLMKAEQTSYRTLAWTTELRRLLYEKQVQTRIYDGYVQQPGFFRRLSETSPHDTWVLVYPNSEALEWCHQQKIRAIVAGTIAQEAHLPSVDIHYQALCRHAAGRMAQLGHQNIAFILPQREWGADAESIAGFQEGASDSGLSAGSVSIEYHQGTPQDLCVLTDRLLARETRPTAWLIAVAPHFLTVMMHLLQRGIAIPAEISLVSQDAEPWQHFATPQPARYVGDTGMLAKKTARLVLETLAGKSPHPKPQRVIPELIMGQTLAPPSN